VINKLRCTTTKPSCGRIDAKAVTGNAKDVTGHSEAWQAQHEGGVAPSLGLFYGFVVYLADDLIG